jgi:hypothetical protein
MIDMQLSTKISSKEESKMIEERNIGWKRAGIINKHVRAVLLAEKYPKNYIYII